MESWNKSFQLFSAFLYIGLLYKTAKFTLRIKLSFCKLSQVVSNLVALINIE